MRVGLQCELPTVAFSPMNPYMQGSLRVYMSGCKVTLALQGCDLPHWGFTALPLAALLLTKSLLVILGEAIV